MTKAEQPTITQALKPCPFCGGITILTMETLNIDGGRVGNPYRITCNRCFVSTGQYITEAEAQAAWNTRASLAAQDGMAKALGTIVFMMGNVNHDRPGGANDALIRGGMLMDCKAVAKAALSAIKGDKS